LIRTLTAAVRRFQSLIMESAAPPAGHSERSGVTGIGGRR